MFDNQEQLIDKHERKAKELAHKFENLEGKFDQLFADYQISRNELTDFLKDPQHFDHQTWLELQKVRQNLDQKLTQEIECIKDPLKTKNKYRDLRNAQNWIPVR